LRRYLAVRDLARLETGRHEPTLTTLGKLAKALKVKTGALLG
jgi:transcriptional regulator with XRE-family HTH domain